MRALARGNALLIVLLTAHSIDHLSRHPSGHRRTSPQAWAAALLLYALVSVALVAARRRHRLAPRISVASGFGTFAGPLLAHAAPVWGPFSMPYQKGHADPLSWGLLLAAAAGGASVGIVGVTAELELREAGRP
jgi:drug/metabolite transporter (DMT)-like permease